MRSTIAVLLLIVISSADSTPNNNDGSESGVSEEQSSLSNRGGGFRGRGFGRQRHNTYDSLEEQHLPLVDSGEPGRFSAIHTRRVKKEFGGGGRFRYRQYTDDESQPPYPDVAVRSLDDGVETE